MTIMEKKIYAKKLTIVNITLKVDNLITLLK